MNVFTRILLALFGVVSWRAVPMMPVEIMLLPMWFPFHLSKVSYWARTVIVPLLVLNAKRPVARNPRGVRIDELFRGAPVNTGLLDAGAASAAGWFRFFRGVDVRAAHGRRPVPEGDARARGARGGAFVDERLNGEDGLGAIFPAMANSVMMYDVLGYPADHPNRAIARQSIDKLLVIKDERSILPAVSVAGVGHVARGARAARNRRSACRAGGSNAGSHGCVRCRFSTCAATGSRAVRTCGRAAGRSSTTIRTTRTSTIRRWS